jgi:hypothetical protein
VEHEDEGYTAVVVINTGTEDKVDVGYWVDYFGATHPVLYDEDETVRDMYESGSGPPHFTVIDRDMTILWKGAGTFGHADAEELLTSLLAKK